MALPEVVSLQVRHVSEPLSSEILTHCEKLDRLGSGTRVFLSKQFLLQPTTRELAAKASQRSRTSEIDIRS
jgi:hypothetical protein